MIILTREVRTLKKSVGVGRNLKLWIETILKQMRTHPQLQIHRKGTREKKKYNKRSKKRALKEIMIFYCEL